MAKHKHISLVHLYYSDGKTPAEGKRVCFGNYAPGGRDWESEKKLTDKDGVADIPHDRECEATIIVDGKIVREHIRIPGEFRAQLRESPSCFPGNVKVLTPNGYKLMHVLMAGDAILSLNRRSVAICHIKHVIRHTNAQIWAIRFDSTRQPLRVTRFHTLLTSRGWLRVDKLNAGDTLMAFENGGCGWVVKEIVPEAIEDVFNLITTGPHNFIVEGVVAHNFTTLRVARTILHQLLLDPLYVPPSLIPQPMTRTITTKPDRIPTA